MTDDTPLHDTPIDATPERARIEAPPPRRLDALPVLYVVGFVILASALIYLWKHPALPRSAALQAVHVDTMRQQIDTMAQQIAALQARPAVADPAKLEAQVAALEARPATAAANLGPLEGRIGALEARPVPGSVDLKPLEGKVAALEGKPAVDLRPVEARIAALEGKPAVDLKPLEGKVAALEAKPPVDLGPLSQRLDGLSRKEAEDAAGLHQQTAQISGQVDQVAAQAKQNAAAIAAVTQRAQLASRLTSMGAALAAGQRLGDVPGAPPALAKFAHDAPPTEAGLRLSFDKAATAAHAASQPDLMGDKPFLERMWSRASQSVTVRQGDTVIVGDPIAGYIEHARQQLDAGDLAGAVATLNGGLQGPAKAAMADWIGQAQSLLDARKAIGELAAQG